MGPRIRRFQRQSSPAVSRRLSEVCSALPRGARCERSLIVAPAMILGDVESWAIVGAVVLLIVLTVQMRRYRRRLDEKRNAANESDREPEGGP